MTLRCRPLASRLQEHPACAIVASEGTLLGLGFSETEAFLKERGVALHYDMEAWKRIAGRGLC